MMNQKFAMCQKQLFETVLLHLLFVITFTIVTLLFSIYHLQYYLADCLVLLNISLLDIFNVMYYNVICSYNI